MSNFSDNKRKIYLASCLYDCIEDNNIRAIKQLLTENGANPNIIIPDRGISPFHLAVGHGSEQNAIEIIKMFLANDGNPNIRSDESLTPVHIAAAWGRLQILNILLFCGGDPCLTDEEGFTSLDYAKQENHEDIINFLNNYLNELNVESCEKISYDMTLDKVIINSGSIVAEYGTHNAQLTLDPDNVLKSLPSNNIVNSYVHNWLAHTKTDNTRHDDTCLDSSDDCSKSVVSRESGILTIPSDTSSQEENFIDLFNNCIIINSDDSMMKTTTNSSAYVTCDSVNSFEKNIYSIMTDDLTDNSAKVVMTDDFAKDNLTENVTNHVTNVPCQLSRNHETDDSIVSITEEYKYIDKENDIVLIEKRILVNPKSDEAKSVSSVNTKSSKVSTLPSILEYDTDTLRLELTARGETPGPITKTTKRVYLKQLKKLQKENIFLNTKRKTEQRVYSVELEKTLRDPNWSKDLTQFKTLEHVVSNQFTSPDPNKRWREGVTKASFTYLLLDPRITENLPARSDKLEPNELWRTFLSAIFYVGKGKRSRPYSHLYQAVTYWKTKTNQHHHIVKENKKIEYILNIWKEQFGVICLHIFQNVIPVEAYTREAAMIHALKLQNLCNSKCGDFYGICATWPEKQKRLLGVYLLYRAMLIFINEGERQLRPDDIGK